MKHHTLTALTLLLANAAAFGGTEKEIPLNEVPADMKDKAVALLHGFSLGKAQIETETDGSKTYELIGEHDGIVTEIDFNEDGSLQEYEKQLPIEQVPFAVRKAIHTAYPGIQFKEFEVSFNEHHKVYQYEVVGDIDGKTIDLEVSPTGQDIKESDS
ncbi:MAG: hypothetical protein ACSHX7_05230 [Luteolibacter sp.]